MEPTRRKVLVVGNPNVGKSLVFSRITGLSVVTANYPGTTVDVKVGRFSRGDSHYELVDMPGIYSLEASTAAEQQAVRLLDSGDILLNVIDATNLERNLNLTLQLIRRRAPMVVCLNFWDEAAHKGVSIDSAELERILGVPVVPVSAQYDRGIVELVDALGRATVPNDPVGDKDSWQTIGELAAKVQKLSHRHHTPLEWLSDFTLHPLGGAVTALAVLVGTFWAIRGIAESLITRVLTPIFDHVYSPMVMKLVSAIPVEALRTILVGQGNDVIHAFGILTTGVYIAVVQVFPYFFAFYTVFGILEDFGFLPRLAIALDNVFHRIGLHGYSAIAVMLGLGCKVPAFIATRMLATEREKVLTMALIMMSAPCMPQSAMIFSLGMHYGGLTVAAVFVTLLLVAIVMSLLLNRVIKGESTELFLEIPSYRMPSAPLMLRKLGMRMAEYFRETIPMIALGVLVINLLAMMGVVTALDRLVGKPSTVLLGLPPDVAMVVVLGFLRKDVSIAMLAPFGLTAGQFIVASVFLVLYLPCIASFFSIIRETGLKGALKVVGLTFVCALVVATALHWTFVAWRWVAG